MKLNRLNAPSKISVKTSLIFLAVALVLKFVPFLGWLAFWVLLAAYSFLFWSTVLRKM